MFTAVHQDLMLAQAEIADVRTMEGWHAQCQLLVKANCGYDFAAFSAMLAFITDRINAELDGDGLVATTRAYREFERCQIIVVLTSLLQVWDDNVDEGAAPPGLERTRSMLAALVRGRGCVTCDAEAPLLGKRTGNRPLLQLVVGH